MKEIVRGRGKVTLVAFAVSALIVVAGLCAATPAQQAHASTISKVTSVKVSNVNIEGFTIKWATKAKSTKTSGYQIYLYKNGTKYRSYSIKNRTIGLKTVKSLPSGAKYTTKVRAYKVVNSKRQYGKWSDSKTVRTPYIKLGSLDFVSSDSTALYRIKGAQTWAQDYNSYLVIIEYSMVNMTKDRYLPLDLGSSLKVYRNGVRLTEAVTPSSDSGSVAPGKLKTGYASFLVKNIDVQKEKVGVVNLKSGSYWNGSKHVTFNKVVTFR